MLPWIGLGVLLVAPLSLPADEVDDLRKAMRHEEAVEALKPAVESGDAAAAQRLAEITLEAALIARLGGAPKKPEDLIAACGALELNGAEALVLARLAFLHAQQAAGEVALGRARDLDPGSKDVTDRMLAGVRGEPLPAGGYFRYRGAWMALAERDRNRLLDRALESLWAVAPDREAFRMQPESDVANRAVFEERWGGGGAAFLRRRAEEARAPLTDHYREVRSWITSYTAEKIRDRVLATFDALAEPRAEALALIAKYEKPQQAQVDGLRARLTREYKVHAQLVMRDWRAVDAIDPVRAHAILTDVRMREDALAHVDRYLAAHDGRGLAPAAIEPPQHAGTSPGHVLPGRAQSGLEDVLWLVLHHAADQHQDGFVRATELLRVADSLTAWERFVVREAQARSVAALNAIVATSLDASERECCEALDEYRTILGLALLSIDERLVASSRKHSQEMADLGYFGHISPVARNRSPTDRARLEGFAGGVGENCLGGRVSGRGAFEGWYRSPGHHRNMVGSGPQIGVGAAKGHGMWTMVAGGQDYTWRVLHRDLPPERHAALGGAVEGLVQALIEERATEDELETVRSQLPDVLPVLAERAFAAVGAGRAPLARAAPVLLTELVRADVPSAWRPLQVAAVAAAIDVMDTSNALTARTICFELVGPLVETANTVDTVDGDGHGYLPGTHRAARRDAIGKLRQEWEDVAQLRYRPAGIAEIAPQPTIPGRSADGPSERAALRALTKKERRRLAKKHGGGTDTENAVDAGLAWLAGAQSEDGGWRARSFALRLENTEGFEGQFGQGNAEWEIAMTGLALLAFTSAGHTIDQGGYTREVESGARFLMERVMDFGRFETGASHYMYSHAIATQALCELYAYSDDPILGVYAQETIDFLIHAQDEKTGGWRYEANEAGDTSVTGWVVMALNAGYKAGLDVAGFREGLRFIDSVTDSGYYEVRYMPGARGGTNRLGSIGALCRLFLKGDARDPRVLWGGRRMLNELPAAGREDFYYWYYGSLTMFQLAGDFWKEWNAALVPALLKTQNRDKRSPFQGAWPSRGEYAGQGGRVMQTALAVLMLTTYYRYDRDHDLPWHPISGNVAEVAQPYLDIVLGDGNARTRAIAETKMLDALGTSVAPVLIQALREEEREAASRKRLARMLVRVVSSRHEHVVLELLAEETDGAVRDEFARALTLVCSARSVEGLGGQLANESRVVRLLAARTLGRLGVAAAAGPLGERMKVEKDAGVKGEIEKALARLTDPGPLVRLVDTALGADDPRRLAVLDGLATLARGDLARGLLDTREREPELHARLIAAVKEHGAEAAVPVAILVLESERVELRGEAIKLLRALTGSDRGFTHDGPADQRRGALRRWKEWWEALVEEAH
ncbi:MAG: hypothetical protein GY711_17455 [bacterium]|nr:hypothetical protein [bacterium]